MHQHDRPVTRLMGLDGQKLGTVPLIEQAAVQKAAVFNRPVHRIIQAFSAGRCLIELERRALSGNGLVNGRKLKAGGDMVRQDLLTGRAHDQHKVHRHTQGIGDLEGLVFLLGEMGKGANRFAQSFLPIDVFKTTDGQTGDGANVGDIMTMPAQLRRIDGDIDRTGGQAPLL